MRVDNPLNLRLDDKLNDILSEVNSHQLKIETKWQSIGNQLASSVLHTCPKLSSVAITRSYSHKTSE